MITKSLSLPTGKFWLLPDNQILLAIGIRQRVSSSAALSFHVNYMGVRMHIYWIIKRSISPLYT